MKQAEKNEQKLNNSDPRDNFPKNYESSAEGALYEKWEASGFFTPEKVEEVLNQKGLEVKKPFTMTLPPPNANGELHLGHTCGYSFQDAMGRFNRMRGHPTLLLPGKDHASIQTEAVYTKILEEQGIDKWNLGRERFYEMCYEFCLTNAKNAKKQEERIGLSADWTRDFFTLDPRLNEVINETFFRLLEDGLIYRGKYLINQCPHCRTALADVDTEKKEMRGIMAYIIYPFTDEKLNDIAEKKFGYRGIMIATTRPETMLGDTAVAVNPNDQRFKEFVGATVKLPIADREIPVIADDEIDMEKGSGGLKVTPAHSPIDFEMAQRHGLEIINVIDEEGKMSGDIPERFKGMDTIDCSKALCAELKAMELLTKVENIKHEVAVCERCGTPIQPIISNQWFVNVEPLAERALEALDRGETRIIPDGQQAALIHFFKNIKPWCISRQLWWGQKIPVWYSGGKKLHDWLANNPGKTTKDWENETGLTARGTGKIFAQLESPTHDSEWVGPDDQLWFEEESDIFDTWFSSGQWPFSTLGGPNGDDFQKYYPTDVMETARDILFWWVARMMMLGIHRTGKSPFATVFLHGLVLASDGTKMSKSKGNGTPPAYIFDKYGADPLRLWYFTDALPGGNTPLQEDKIKGNRNFINKIWNASRFIITNLDPIEIKTVNERLNSKNIRQTDRIKRLDEHRQDFIKYMEGMKFHLAAEAIREFFWHEFCDVWIEEIKAEIQDKELGSEERIAALTELLYILKENLKLMHCLLPYVTESIWQELVKLELAEGWLIVEQID